jgi:hypothetical protein
MAFGGPGAWFPVYRNYLAAQVSQTLTNYDLQFDLHIIGALREWGSIMHITSSADYPRTPGIWIYPGITRIHVRVSQQNSINDGCDTQPLSLGTHIFRLTVQNQKMTVTVDGQVQCRQSFSGPVLGLQKPFWYLSDPFYAAANVLIRNLVYGPVGIADKAEGVMNRGRNLACGKPTRQVR